MAKYPDVSKIIGESDNYRILKCGGRTYLVSWNFCYGYAGVSRLENDSWEEVFFSQDEGADELLDLVDRKGPGGMLKYLYEAGAI